MWTGTLRLCRWKWDVGVASILPQVCGDQAAWGDGCGEGHPGTPIQSKT